MFERHAAPPVDAVAERNDAILIKQMAIAGSAPADVVVCGAWWRVGFGGGVKSSVVCIASTDDCSRGDGTR